MNNIFKKYFSKQEEYKELKQILELYGKAQYLEPPTIGATTWESSSIVQIAPNTAAPNINPTGYGSTAAASAPMSYPDPDCDDGDEISSSGSPNYAKLKSELKQEIVTEVFEEIFKQLVDVEIISQKEMKEKLKRIMDRMGY
jgi:hypothetical protein